MQYFVGFLVGVSIAWFFAFQTLEHNMEVTNSFFSPMMGKACVSEEFFKQYFQVPK